jgi:hypothetical protein
MAQHSTGRFQNGWLTSNDVITVPVAREIGRSDVLRRIPFCMDPPALYRRVSLVGLRGQVEGDAVSRLR